MVTIGELKDLSDESIKQMDEDGYYFSCASAAKYIKKYYKSIEEYNELIKDYNKLLEYLWEMPKATMLEFKCPNCHDRYKIKPEDYIYNKSVKCLKCGHEYMQKENMVNFICNNGEVE